MSRRWNHKVVRRSRGAGGKFFSYPAAATFDSKAEAVAEAYRMAWSLAGTAGTYISVQTRGGRAVTEINLPNGKEST